MWRRAARDRGHRPFARQWAAPVIAVALGAAMEAAAGPLPPPVYFDDVSPLIPFSHRSEPFDGDGLAGAAWLDYDRDGRLDLFLTNGRTQANGLFRNDGHGGFVDVSASAGIEDRRGSSGVVAADFDNDGFTDLLLTGDGGILVDVRGTVALYRNNGDGAFSDVTNASGIDGPPTGIVAAAADIDNDGLLDVFIAAAGSLETRTQYPSRLYRNNGDFTFTDISVAAGVDRSLGAFGTMFIDVDRDGWVDLFVANGNDVAFLRTPNQLFHNRGDGTFEDVSANVGVTKSGFWMGTCGADWDNDGDTDLFVTNLGANAGSPHALYRNNGDGTFTDVGADAGAAGFPFGWGCAFKDFDNDGHPDLYFAGSLPRLDTNRGTLLFSDGNGRFIDFTASSPVRLEGTFPSGIASADYDGDGFEDLVIMQETEPGHPVLLHNRGNGNAWLTTHLVGTHSNRGGVGAHVWVSAGGQRQVREVFAGSSFASTESPWLTFGLGTEPSVERVDVRWPSGLEETFGCVGVRRIATLIEGEGPISCLGDCDGDGAITIAELVRGMSIALGSAALAVCPTFDVDGDGQVAVDELLRAVRRSLAS